LGEDFKKEEVTMIINVALLRTNFSTSLRLFTSSVVSMLERRNIQEVVEGARRMEKNCCVKESR